ncbi:MAG TPA: hypothetical protein VLL28_01720 [Hyphomicrobiaceae bacterium]|nr:hypothetical protein [Hyphomicrobiaceae bacterium]
MWQVHEALRRQRKARSTGKTAKEEKLPRRWTELILRLNDIERSNEQDRRGRGALKRQGLARGTSTGG